MGAPQDEEGAGTITWREVGVEAERRLVASGRPAAASEVRRLIEEVTGAEAAEYHEVVEQRATRRRLARFDALLARRLAGEPLQYVLGRWSFRHLDLLVDRRVLIPRPETEQVVEVALAEVDRLVAAGGVSYEHRLAVADLGTGSGAIGLSLAVERPLVDVWASDLSADALAVARANLAGIGRAGVRVRLTTGSWFEALPPSLRGQFAVIVSNPPYVPAGAVLPAEVADWEPRTALVPGPSGREALDHLVDGALDWLRPGGALVVEVDPDQAELLQARASAAGYGEVLSAPDLSGSVRALVARRAPAERSARSGGGSGGRG